MSKKKKEKLNINNLDDIKTMLYALIDTINYAQEIQKQHDCNDCGRGKGCELSPMPGNIVRINCYAWKPENKQ